MLFRPGGPLLMPLGALTPSSGGGAWTPASLTNLIGWWEARLGVTESGGAASQQDDLSGFVNHMSQMTGANKPAYSATSFNGGFPGLTFNKAAPSFLSRGAPTLTSTANFSIFVLLDFNGNQDANAGVVCFVEGSNINDYGNAGSFVLATNATDGVFIYSNNANLHDDIDTSGNPSLVGFTAAVGSPTQGYLNGSLTGSSLNNLPTNIGGPSGGNLEFGTRGWNGYLENMHGVMSLVVMGAAVWDATQIGLLKTYCNTNYGTSF